MLVCVSSTASHLSTANTLPPVVVSELHLERLSSPPHHRNIKPFCVSKHFRLPITRSWKSEKDPINLADPQFSSVCRAYRKYPLEIITVLLVF